MATDIWNGNGTWSVNLGDWSLGVAPTAGNNVLIQSGTDTLNSAGVAAGLTIAPLAALFLTGAGTLAATNVTNYGTFNVGTNNGDGANNVTLTGAFTNFGTATFGNSFLSSSMTVSAARFANSGTLSIVGNNSLGSAQTTLSVATAAPGTLTGGTFLYGDASLQFASGAITTISSGATLRLTGSQARVTIGAGTTNSALSTLATNPGTLQLEGDQGSGPGGATVTTTGALSNGGALLLDVLNGDGASQMTIGGTLTNVGTVSIGNQFLSANTTLQVANLNNLGTINLAGNGTLATTAQATLNDLAAAPSTLTGVVNLSGDADLRFGSGGVTSVGAGATLSIAGQQARVSTGAGTTNSALTALASNYGTLQLEGDLGGGPGGTTVSTSVAFSNNNNFYLDHFNGGGASSFTTSGLLTNNANIQVGNDFLSANSTLTANALANNGTIYVDSQRTGGAGQALAKLNVLSAAPSTSSGYLRVAGNSLIDFSSGAIQSIGFGAGIELDGAAASIAIGANGSNSALTTLSSNAGTLLLRGNNGFGGGVVLTTTAGFTNNGIARIDFFNGDGGDTVTFGGALNNTSEFDIGNQFIGVATTVNATSLSNTGSLTLQGNAAGVVSAMAKLAISGPANGNVSDFIRVGGNATLNFGSGTGLTSVALGGQLELDGGQANVSIGAGAQNSGLAQLASNAGTLLMRGNSGFGVGGVAFTTSGQFVNTGNAQIDFFNSDGGDNVQFGGALINSNTLSIGNQFLSAATIVQATSLRNTGGLVLQGNVGGPTSAKATLAISGAAISSVTNAMRISGNATLSYGSGSGLTSVAVGGTLELDGSLANVKVGAGAQNSGLSAFSLNSGAFVLRGNSGYGAGGVTLTTTSGFSNNGTAYVDYFNGDGGSNVTIGGVLNNAGTFNVGNQFLAASTVVNATSLVNTGSVTIQGVSGATGASATFNISGAAAPTVTKFLRIGGNAKLDFGSGTGITVVGFGGTLELDGQNANVAIGAGAQNSGLVNLVNNSGLLDLRGNSGFGTGGVTLNTAGAFTNSGTTYFDFFNGDGGDAVTFGSTLVNQGTLDIGNQFLVAATTVQATALANTGSLTIQGNSNVAGPRATLAISGASPGVVTNAIRLAGSAKLSFGSGNGLTTIIAGGSLELDSAQASVVVGAGGQNSGLAKLSNNAGTLVLRGNSGFGAGGVSLTTTAGFVNSGVADIDFFNGDGGGNVTFGGTLTNQGTFNLGNQFLSAASTVSATNLSNLSGQINIQGNGNASTLSIGGVANNYAGVNVAAGGVLSVTGAYNQYGGATTIGGTMTASGYTQFGGATTVNGTLNVATVNDRGGTITFNSALTAGSATTSLTMMNGAVLDFTAGVSSSQTVTFQDATDVLKLGSAGTFGGTIGGFVDGDAIQLLNQAATSLSFSAGVLNVFNGASQIAALHLTGSYTTSSFTLGSDNLGGSLILV